MLLRYRLILIVAIASLLPLLAAGLATAREANRNMIELSQEVQLREAKELSTLTETWLEDRIRGLELVAGSWDVGGMSGEALLGLLRLIYDNDDAINVVALVSEQGELLAGPEYLEAEYISPVGRYAAHEAVDADRAELFVDRVPWADALASGVAMGRPYQPDGARAVVVPLAVAVDGGVLAGELSLTWLAERFADRDVEGRAVALLGSGGELLAGVSSALLDQRTFKNFTGDIEGELIISLEDGTDVLETFDAVADLGWYVVVASPLYNARFAARQIRRTMLFFYGLAGVLTLAVGFVGAQQISRPVVDLKDAALAVAAGELGRRVEPGGSKELEDLGNAFNFMSRRLRQNRDEISRQSEEIEAFNRDLQRRVEEATRELREAQSRLVESSRLAAVAHMGAGLAHELNNPVAGILGMTQLAIARTGKGPLGPTLRSIETQAQRCREILGTLNRLTHDGPGEREDIELHGLIDSVLELIAGRLAERGVEVVHRRAEPLDTRGDPARLGQAISQLLLSLSARLDAGGRVTITGARRPDALELCFSLEGPERVARDDWLASGMGFWIAHQVVGQHQGWLEESGEDGPPEYRVFLPPAD